MAIPKIIWFLWYQGIEQAPPIVRKCYESWQTYNPNWRVIFLDEKNLGEYITISVPGEKFCQLSKNHRSDVIRSELLGKYGGVWADATTLCRLPLDDWLEDYNQAGFFTFVHETRGYGWIYNWFIAAEAGNPIAVKMNQKFTAFFRENDFYHHGEVASKRIIFLEKFLNRKYKTTRLWTSWPVRKLFKVYPYFIFHFIFANLINSDRELLNLYRKMKPFYTEGDLGIKRLLRPLTPKMKHSIDTDRIPVYKLSWKYREEDYTPESILHYLLEETGSIARRDSDNRG